MTARSVPEWIGKTPDTPAPPRVRVRVWDRERGRCHKCERKIPTGDKWILEHRQALINSGENRESNLCLTCEWCLPEKNREDLAIKSKTARVRSRHLGIKQPKRKIQSRSFGYQPSNTRDIHEDVDT